MGFTIKTTKQAEDAAKFVASAILKKLKEKKRVLFFVTGGSSISVGVLVAKILKKHPHKNLTIMLTDERYGRVGHKDSNWQQLLEKGFDLPEAKIIPVLSGDSLAVTTKKFNTNLARGFKKSKEIQYKIGLFGIGSDGHTAGILPGSGAVLSKKLAFGYDAPTFSRITITPKAIEKLDEAIVWAQGKEKWEVLKDLQKNNSILKQPAQILKKVPVLTIFTDYLRK